MHTICSKMVGGKERGTDGEKRNDKGEGQEEGAFAPFSPQPLPTGHLSLPTTQ